jgi:protein-tyrosine sulfotransferase
MIFNIIFSFLFFSIRLKASGFNEAMLDAAVRSFIYQILIRHSQNADVLCSKDPFVLNHATYIASLFPASKFLLLIRDARAVIHSVMTRKVSISDFNLTDYRHNFKLWNKDIQIMIDQYTQVGKEKCLIVRYEQLVLQPKKTIQTILKFLGLPWVDAVLHHEKLIGTRISLSK